jgi:alanyl aminopeptidase
MLESWIGPEAFRQGIRGYLDRHAHGNATADDFLEALEGVAAGRPVRRVAKSFLEQRGLPLVAVDWHCEEGRTHFALEQTRYLEAGSRIDPAMGWVQPFCARLIPGDGNDAAAERVCTLIEGRSHSFTVDTPSCPAAVFPNARGAGYYRWTLTAEAWRALLDRLGSLHPAEKFSTASNWAAEFRSGRLSGSAYLEAIRPIVAQPEWDVATQPIDTLTFLSDFVASPEEKPALAAFVGALYAPHLSEDPTRPDAGNEIARRLLREEVLYLLALTLREPERLDAMAQHGFEAIGYRSDGELNLGAVDGDLLEIALASAVEREGEPFFSALVDHLDHSQDGSFRNKAIRALGLTTEPELASELRSLGFLSSLRLNEIPTLLRAQASRVENRPALFAWLKRAFRWGRRFMPEGYLSRVPFLASGFCDAESRADFRDYFSAYEAEIPGLGRNLAQAVESIELCESLVRLQDGLIVPTASSLE